MMSLFDPLRRDMERLQRAAGGRPAERTTPTPPMSSESLWGLTRAQLDAFAPQIADDWERRDMIPKGTRLTVAAYLREIARRMHGTSPPY